MINLKSGIIFFLFQKYKVVKNFNAIYMSSNNQTFIYIYLYYKMQLYNSYIRLLIIKKKKYFFIKQIKFK